MFLAMSDTTCSCDSSDPTVSSTSTEYPDIQTVLDSVASAIEILDGDMYKLILTRNRLISIAENLSDLNESNVNIGHDVISRLRCQLQRIQSAGISPLLSSVKSGLTSIASDLPSVNASN